MFSFLYFHGPTLFVQETTTIYYIIINHYYSDDVIADHVAFCFLLETLFFKHILNYTVCSLQDGLGPDHLDHHAPPVLYMMELRKSEIFQAYPKDT